MCIILPYSLIFIRIVNGLFGYFFSRIVRLLSSLRVWLLSCFFLLCAIIKIIIYTIRRRKKKRKQNSFVERLKFVWCKCANVRDDVRRTHNSFSRSRHILNELGLNCFGKKNFFSSLLVFRKVLEF